MSRRAMQTFRLARMLAPALAGAAMLLATAAPAAPLDGLDAGQRAFATDGKALARLGTTPARLAVELDGRDPAARQAYVAALMAVVEEARFRPGVDQGEIALNPAAPNFNVSTTVRPALLDGFQREAGPFSLDRYMFQKSGIPTFAHAPVALRPADLVAGKVEVAFVGVPLDFSSGYRDAKHAPMFLRAMDGLVGTDPAALVDPNVELRIADYGDLAIDAMSLERSIDHVRMMVGDMAKAGVIPFVVGGDHALMYADVAAMVDVYGKGKVGVVQLDAHHEEDADGDHFISDRQALGRLIADGLIAGRDVVQIGQRDGAAGPEAFARMRAAGIRYHTLAEIERSGWSAMVDRALVEIRSGPPNIFVSFDISVLDPAFATGAGRPVPEGLTMREAVPLVRRLCAESKVIGFEMLDVAPVLDQSYRTTLNANYIMHACLAGIALHRKGLTKANYIDPLSADDGVR